VTLVTSAAIPGPEVFVVTASVVGAVVFTSTGATLWSIALISSMSAIGVTPAIGSFENCPIRNASAPTSFPSMYTGLPLMPATTPV